MAWTVTEVIDGDTFFVTPDWKWKNESGNRVRPTGYDAPEKGEPGWEAAKDKLAGLILNKQVDLKNCVKIDRGRLVCTVYLDGVDIASYFPEYQ